VVLGLTYLEFTVGEPVEVILGFKNNGEKPFNVTQIAASLRYPVDWKVYVQNVSFS
jgi:hypothetical protein